MRQREWRHMLKEFFEGVDAVRAHLDRHIQDPVRRRERLRQIVSELPKKLSSNDLGPWWAEQVGLALGAETAAIYEVGKGWISVLGARGRLPDGESPPDRGCVRVPLSSSLALWLVAVDDLDEGCAQLVEAMGETIGTVLDTRRLLVE